MQLSTGVARVGEKVRLNLVFTGLGSARLGMPAPQEGLRFGKWTGPSRRESLTIRNGRRQKMVESRWALLITCEAEGLYTLPSLALSVDGSDYRTEAVTLKVVPDMTGENLGFFELAASSPKVVEGMPFTLELIFGWDQGVAANYANLSIPWWDNLYGAIEVEREKESQSGESVTVNGTHTVSVERVQSTEHAQSVVFRIRRSYLATRSGVLDLPTSFLEFGKKSKSIFGSGVKSNYFVRANDLALDVIPLPDEGRPMEFSGAVGTFKVRASVDARDLVVGDSIKLTVDWTGQGNMEFFDAPALDRLDEFNGFQFYGSNEEKSLGRRRVIYDLAPLSDEVDHVPPVPLWSFDPELVEYVKLESSPIPLRVRALENAIKIESAGEEESFAADINDIRIEPLSGLPSASESKGMQNADRLLLGASAGMLPLWFLLRSLVRRSGDPSGKREKRRRLATRNLQRDLSGNPDSAACLQAFASYLAARSGECDAAWIGRDLPGYAQAQGWEEYSTDWTAAGELMGRLECAVFAGGPAVDGAELLSMSQRLAEAGL